MDSTTTLDTAFKTYHRSGNDLHVRTDTWVLYIDKTRDDLMGLARELRRGERIRVSGSIIYSTTLSSKVLHAQSIERIAE